MRRLLRAAAVVVVLLILAVVGIWAASYHPTVQAWARDRVVRLLRSATGADLTLGRLSGDLGRTIVLDDVRFASGPGLRVRARRVDVHYSLPALLRGALVLDHVAVDGLRVRATRTDTGASSTRGGALPVTIADLEVTDGRVAVDRDGTRIEARGIAFAGAVSLRPDRQEVHVASLTLVPRGLGLDRLSAAGTATLADGRVALRDAWVATRRSRADLSGTVEPDGRIVATAQLDPLAARDFHDVLPTGWRPNAAGTVSVSGAWPRLAVAARVDLGAAGRVVADGDVDLAGAAPRYAATIDLAAVDLSGLIDGGLVTRAGGRARVRGHGARVAYHLALAPSEIAGEPFTRTWLAGTTRGGVSRVHGTVATTAGSARVRARLALGSPPRYRAEATVDVARLDALVAGVPGRIAGRVRLHGRGLDPRTGGAVLEADVADGLLSGVQLTSGTLRANKAGTRVDVAELHVVAPAGQANVTGTLDIATRAADLAVDATGDLAALGSPLAGTVALALRLRGTPAAPSIQAVATVETERGNVHAVVTLAGARGTLDDLTLSPTGATLWQLARPAPLAVDDGLRITDAVLTSEAQRLTVNGHVGARGPLDATAVLERVRIGPLLALADRPGVDGEASGQVHLTGTAVAPRVDATMTVAGLGMGDTRYGNLDLRATVAERVAEVHAALHHPDAGVLRVDGTVPVTARNLGFPVALDVHADRLDLSFLRVLSPGTLRDLRGHLSADVRLTGPIGGLEANGKVALDDGRVELKSTGAAYEDVHLHLRAAGTRIEVTDLRARGGDGMLTGTGALDANGTLALSLRLEHFRLVRLPAVEAALDGTLDVRGTLTEPELRGDLEVARARVRPAALPATGSVRKPDPTIEVVGRPAEPPSPPSITAAIGEALALDVRVRLGRDTIIERTDANIELGGALHVEKASHQPPSLRGEVRLVRGWYAFTGKRFTIDRGVVTFAGETPPKPVLDVTASHRATDYRVEAHVEGPVDKPTLTLSSDPPLEQADILAVLLFGKPTRALGSNESLDLQQHAIGLATTYATPQLVGSVTSALGIDRLDVTPSLGPGTTGAVRVGRYVVEDVFVSLAQEFGARAGQVVGVEYNLGRSISVRASTSSRGDSGIDLFWRRRY
jgi:autotransporter translocation and assembly factor TamB